jgi:hypothetical protein
LVQKLIAAITIIPTGSRLLEVSLPVVATIDPSRLDISGRHP